jgi:hypothetical protein
MDDICTRFIDGFEVDYQRDIHVEGYEPSDVEKVRILQLCWAVDHPGLCEVGKLLNQVKCGCRVGQHLREARTDICTVVKLQVSLEVKRDFHIPYRPL